MTATFDVTCSKPYPGFVDRDKFKHPYLLIRFAPNPELNDGFPHPTEWQVEVEGKIGLYLDAPEGEQSEFCAEMVESDFQGVPAHVPDHRVREYMNKISLSAVMPHAIGIMHHDLKAFATPLMRELIEQFKASGREVIAVGKYSGSFGPSHMLRDGVFYNIRRKF